MTPAMPRGRVIYIVDLLCRSIWLADDEVVLDPADAADAAGELSGTGDVLGGVDEAAQLNHVLEGRDVHLRLGQRRLVDDLGDDLGGDRRVVDIFACRLAARDRIASTDRGGEREDGKH